MNPKLIQLLACFLLCPIAEARGDPPAKSGAIVVNLETINTSADEDDPNAAPDGSGLFFASNAAGHFDILFAPAKNRRTNPTDVKQLTNAFAKATVLEALSGKSDDGGPFLMPREYDGSEYIFFASQRDAKNFDIFFNRRLRPTEPFSTTAIAAVHQVCTEEDELHPWAVALGQGRKQFWELYFSRKTSDGWRIGVAKGPTARAFDKVDLLDLPPGFHHPSVAKDGLTMYLQGPLDKDRQGLFVSRRPKIADPWGQPEPLTMLNNSEGPRGDFSPSLSRPSGRFLYFASDRPGGKGGRDLYAVATDDLKKAKK